MTAQIIPFPDRRRIRPEPAGNPFAVVAVMFMACAAVVLLAALVQWWAA